MENDKYTRVNLDDVIEQPVNKAHSKNIIDEHKIHEKNTGRHIAAITFIFAIAALIWSPQVQLEITASTSGDIVYKGLKIENLQYSALLSNHQLVFPNLVKAHQKTWQEAKTKNSSNDTLVRHDIEYKRQLILPMKKRITSSHNQLKLIQKQLSIKETLFKKEMAALADVLNMSV